MKRMIVAVFLSLSVNAFACEKGCRPWNISSNQSVCACDEVPDSGMAVKPSDEKPRRSQIPEWQTGNINVMQGVKAVDDYKSVAKIEDTSYYTPNGVPAR